MKVFSFWALYTCRAWRIPDAVHYFVMQIYIFILKLGRNMNYMDLVGYRYHKSVKLLTWGLLLSFMISTIMVILLWFHLKLITGKATPFSGLHGPHITPCRMMQFIIPTKVHIWGGAYNLLALVGTWWVNLICKLWVLYWWWDSSWCSGPGRHTGAGTLLMASHMSHSAPST